MLAALTERVQVVIRYPTLAAVVVDRQRDSGAVGHWRRRKSCSVRPRCGDVPLIIPNLPDTALPRGVITDRSSASRRRSETSQLASCATLGSGSTATV
jgi:hypothetical protein